MRDFLSLLVVLFMLGEITLPKQETSSLRVNGINSGQNTSGRERNKINAV